MQHLLPTITPVAVGSQLFSMLNTKSSQPRSDEIVTEWPQQVLQALQALLVSGAAIPKGSCIASHVFADVKNINAQGLREVLSAVRFKDCLFVVLYGSLLEAHKVAFDLQRHYKLKTDFTFNINFDIVLQLQQGLTDLSSHVSIGVVVCTFQVRFTFPLL